LQGFEGESDGISGFLRVAGTCVTTRGAVWMRMRLTYIYIGQIINHANELQLFLKRNPVS